MNQQHPSISERSMPESTFERGEFQGQVITRLTAIETELRDQRAALWGELKEQRVEIGVLRTEFNKLQGAMVLGRALWAITIGVAGVVGGILWK